MSKVVSLLGRFPKRKPTGNRTRQRALKDAGQIGNGCVELGHQQPSSTPTQYDGSVEFNYTYCINKKIYKRRRRRKRILWMFTLACPVADLRVTLSHPSKPSPSTTLQPTTNPPPPFTQTTTQNDERKYRPCDVFLIYSRRHTRIFPAPFTCGFHSKDVTIQHTYTTTTIESSVVGSLY